MNCSTASFSYSLSEAYIVIEAWRKPYNTKRPHSSRGYQPLALEVAQWPAQPCGTISLAPLPQPPNPSRINTETEPLY